VTTAQGVHTWTTVPPADRPFIVVVDTEDRNQDQGGLRQRRTWVVTIMAIVDAMDSDDKLDLVEALESDITKAIYSDPRRGASPDVTGDFNAVMSTIVGSFREDHPDQQQGILKVIAEIVYYRDAEVT